MCARHRYKIADSLWTKLRLVIVQSRRHDNMRHRRKWRHPVVRNVLVEVAEIDRSVTGRLQRWVCEQNIIHKQPTENIVPRSLTKEQIAQNIKHLGLSRTIEQYYCSQVESHISMKKKCSDPKSDRAHEILKQTYWICRVRNSFFMDLLLEGTELANSDLASSMCGCSTSKPSTVM